MIQRHCPVSNSFTNRLIIANVLREVGGVIRRQITSEIAVTRYTALYSLEVSWSQQHIVICTEGYKTTDDALLKLVTVIVAENLFTVFSTVPNKAITTKLILYGVNNIS